VAKILVVEDDRDLNKAYCIILRHEGHEVIAAFDGKEALAKVADFQPDLVLLDLLMPIMGGLEFLQSWSINGRKNVKILIFTNMENSPEISEAYKLGASRCIIKSWTAPHNLARVVSDTIKNGSSSPKTKKVKTPA
jgi:two-component system response regulator VicR